MGGAQEWDAIRLLQKMFPDVLKVFRMLPAVVLTGTDTRLRVVLTATVLLQRGFTKFSRETCSNFCAQNSSGKANRGV